MGIGQSVKKGFEVLRQSGNVAMALFIFGFIWNLVSVFLQPKGTEPMTPALSALAIGIAVVFILFSVFIQAGSLGYVRDKIKLGKADLSNFFASGGKYYFRVFLLGLIVAALVLAFVLVGALIYGLLGTKMSTLAITIVIFLAAIGIYILIMLFLAPYALIAEEQRVIASIKRSIALVRKNILSFVGLSLILLAIGFAVGMILGSLLAGISFAIKQDLVQKIVFAFLSSFVNAFLGLYVTAVFMNYFLGVSTANTAGAE